MAAKLSLVLIGIYCLGLSHEQETTSAPDTRGIVWGPALSAEDFHNAKYVQAVSMTDEARKATRDGIESEVLHKEKNGKLLNALVSARWPNNVVPYTLDSAFSSNDRAVIAAAMLNIMDNTCVRFRGKTAADIDWMSVITTGVSGCYANARYYGPGWGEHKLGLQSPGCMWTGVIVHEFLHILGISHEMCRPDRDDYLTVNWLNVEVDKASNFWKMEWDYAPTGLPKCSSTGLTQPTDFSNCVDGTKVQAYGTPYDFDSVMHYSLDSFAFNTSQLTLIPKDSANNNVNVGSQAFMSPIDIVRLNKGYSCIGTQFSSAGSNIQACGGVLNGTIPSSGNLQWAISTTQNMGIYINFTKWTCGSSDVCLLQIWSGVDSTGTLFVTYNSTNPPPNNLLVPYLKAYIKFNATSPTVGFMAAWSCSSITCCSSVELASTNTDFLGSYSTSINGTFTQNGTIYNNRTFYKHSSGGNCLWYADSGRWLINGCNEEITTSSGFVFGPADDQCPHFPASWNFYSQTTSNTVSDPTMSVSCSPGVTVAPPQIVEWTTTTVTDSPTVAVTAAGGCCSNIYLNSSSAGFKNTSNNLYMRGKYYPLAGSVHNNRQVYINVAVRHCMWFNNNNMWMVSDCSSDRNSTSGYIMGSDSTCPDASTTWKYYDSSLGEFTTDPTMTVSCLPDITTAQSSTSASPTTAQASTTAANTTAGTTAANTTAGTTAANTTAGSTAANTTAANITVVATAANTTAGTIAANTTAGTTAANTTAGTTAANTTAGSTAANTTAGTTAANTTAGSTAANTTAGTTAANTTASPTAATSSSAAASTASGSTTASTPTGPVATAATTVASSTCPSCNNVLSGSFVGLYNFVSSNDSRCPGGCVYSSAANAASLFCFTDSGAEPVENCSLEIGK